MDPATLKLLLAGGGALGSGIGSYFANRGKNNVGQTRFIADSTQEQQDASSQLLQRAMSMIGQGSGFAPIEQQARENFSQNTIPSISERFTSMGQGAQSSSAFPQSIGQAGAGLESSLASQRSQFENRDLMNLLQLGLTPQGTGYQEEEQPGIGKKFSGQMSESSGTFLKLLFDMFKEGDKKKEEKPVSTQSSFNMMYPKGGLNQQEETNPLMVDNSLPKINFGNRRTSFIDILNQMAKPKF